LKPNYGIDAPGVIRNLVVIGLAAIVVPIFLPSIHFSAGGTKVNFDLTWLFVSGGFMFATGLFMIWGSKVGKFWLKDKILEPIAFKGDEQVLDIGCGHGLLLISTAKKLTTGRSTGIDLWSNVDQAANTAEATAQNAQLEGVLDRIKIDTGDAQKLPYDDNTFDVVVSNWAIHNIPTPQGREMAIEEAYRVLKPGGAMAISDIAQTKRYRSVLERLGARSVTSRRLYIYSTTVVRASK
jgi:SAM-dependent methyltransferase